MTSSESWGFGHYYAQLANQQHMLEDTTRTGAYQWAVTRNREDFADKVVVDVGAGTGILSILAAQAGARRVFAVEASPMAEHARSLIAANGFADTIEVIHGRIEEIDLPEPADLLISEPMGVFLLHERMLESFITARERWLHSEGKMFPGRASLFVAPFSDSYLHSSTMTKALFWEQPNFFGFDLTSLAAVARQQHFSQPVVGPVAPAAIQTEAVAHDLDFQSVRANDLQQIRIDLDFTVTSSTVIHGLAGWFDVTFAGSTESVRLDTSPTSPRTHWYQTRFLFEQPIALQEGASLDGSITLTANERGSYDISIVVGEMQQVYELQRQRYWWHTS